MDTHKMITVDEARQRLLDLVRPTNTEKLPLALANGRVLRQTACAIRDQPPFDAAAMDGYAVIANQEPPVGQSWQVIGQSAAGHRFIGTGITPSQAVRIFTGAPLPENANRVIIQEDITRKGDYITLSAPVESQTHVRPRGTDFTKGFALSAPKWLGPAELTLLAAMNVADVAVSTKPEIALLATGDELVFPGETPRDDQIVCSTVFGLKAMFETAGARVRLLPIARDRVGALEQCFAQAEGVDLLVTIGGASVGDHDLVAQVSKKVGFKQQFHKVRMRPGKPLMAGQRGTTAMIGLPGNPASALVCATVFVIPVIKALLGLSQVMPVFQTAPLAMDINANGPREHYMRGVLKDGCIKLADRQDSSLLSVFQTANVLVKFPPNAPAQQQNTNVSYILIKNRY